MHNETANIWTHLLYIVYLIYYMSEIFKQDWSVENKIIMSIGVTGVLFMASASTIYHTFRDQGKRLSLFLLKTDFGGIVIMLYLLTVCGVSLSLRHQFSFKVFMLLLISAVFGANLMLSFTACCPGNHHK